MPSVRARLKFRSSPFWPRISSGFLPVTYRTTEIAMGSIMTAVAVLEIHIDRKAVETMNPRTIALGLEPRSQSTWMAILL